MKRNEMRELLEKEEEILNGRVFAEKDGAVFVSFEDAAVLNSVNAFDPKGTGLRALNPDGSVASTGKTVHAMNPDYFFLNRYKLKGKKLYIVSGHTPDGYRCIREQTSGRVFLKNIPCYIIARGEDKKLYLEKVTNVSDVEFISEFTNTLTHQAMAEILPLIAERGAEVTANEMPI